MPALGPRCPAQHPTPVRARAALHASALLRRSISSLQHAVVSGTAAAVVKACFGIRRVRNLSALMHLIGDHYCKLVLVGVALERAGQPEEARRTLGVPVSALACQIAHREPKQDTEFAVTQCR